MSARDYSDYLYSLKTTFLNTPGVKQRPIKNEALKYTNALLNDIIAKNEIFFKELKTAEITLIDAEAPLHFSLSKGQIFLSTGLVSKYIKHESMLVSVIAFELVRSEKLLYPKDTLVPVGFLPLEKMLIFSRLNSDEKVMIHKWAHHITVRSGYDGEYYLSWLQTQNRNTADFIMQVGDANQITREEAAFKAFLIKKTNEDSIPIKKNSSKQFYSFLNSVRDGVI